jgi:hypothetical protein
MRSVQPKEEWQDGARGRQRQPHAPQVRCHRLRQTDRSRLPRFLQLLRDCGQEERENLLLIRDRRVAVSYVVEALRIFDHYLFRVAQEEAATGARKELVLATPPRNPGEEPWWAEEYTVAQKIRDRELFA